MGDIVIFPIRSVTYGTIYELITKSDPPLGTKDNLVVQAVALLQRVFDIARTRELVFSELANPTHYHSMVFPFWTKWLWDAKRDQWIDFVFDNMTLWRIEYLITCAPGLEDPGKVIAAAVSTLRIFHESKEEKRVIGFRQCPTGKVTAIRFPFWKAYSQVAAAGS